MASRIPLSSPALAGPRPHPPVRTNVPLSPQTISLPRPLSCGMKRRASTVVVVAAYGDVSADSTTYLVAGALAVALLGTAFPILFARKDLCPECDGAGFVRSSNVRLRTNAARKDLNQIVCPKCNGLGKLGQIDK